MDPAAPVCWKCGASLEDIPLPPGRLAECPSCRAELHVCVACVFYDISVAKHCREPIAEEVQDKTRANFCDYFQLRPDAYRPRDERAAQDARSQLEALFGGAAQSGQAPEESSAQSDAQKARSALEDLFKPPRKEH